MADIFDKCERFLAEPKIVHPGQRELAADLFSSVSPPSNAGPWMASNGRKLLQFSSNDYLGLAMHSQVRDHVVRIVQQHGICSPMGSRLLTGTTEYHLQLEKKVADFKRCEAAVTFPSGAMAMIGTLASLAGPDDLLILDEYAHASLVCGARASAGKLVFFRHNDLEHLENILSQAPDSAGRAIVVDGVYSMQGDIAPLGDLVALKKKYAARLIVDDAHGTGVFGPQGRGTAAHFKVENEIDLHAGTFSKAVGTAGGFVAGGTAAIEFFRYNAPTYVFSKAMPLAVVGATLVALDLLQEADARREKLWANKQRLQEGLRASGADIGNTQSPITPIHAEGNDALYIAHKMRHTCGIWVAPVLYPAVKLGSSMLRVIPTALHDDADIDSLIRSITMIRCSMILGSIPAG